MIKRAVCRPLESISRDPVPLVSSPLEHSTHFRRGIDWSFSICEVTPGFEEQEIWKTAQTLEILAALKAERVALLGYIFCHEGV